MYICIRIHTIMFFFCAQAVTGLAVAAGAMASVLRQTLQEQCEYLKSLKEITLADPNTSPTSLEDLTTEWLARTRDIINTSDGTSTADAIECIKCLGQTPLSGSQRADLAKIIHEKTAGISGKRSEKPRQESQCCLYLQNLLREKDWKVLHGDTPWSKKVNYIGEDICGPLGLSNATAITKTHMCAMLYIAMAPGDTVQIDTDDFYAKRRELSDHLEKRFKHKAHWHGKVAPRN